ncbi:Cyclin-dependent kinases regulatory subunit [Diplonema papillatum]|nr:Cyclin-dependent kinases regulatory subunit [Diplonema papillatum]
MATHALGPVLDTTRNPKAQSLINAYKDRIRYSEKYCDDVNEYRHVILPKELKKLVPNRLMTESEWRSLGVQQSLGWEHYMVHAPELHVLCFRRPLPRSGI